MNLKQNKMDIEKLFKKWNINCSPKLILDKWQESGRYYHDSEHLIDLISQIEEDFGDGKITPLEREKLHIVALFHDIIYVPGLKNNEEKSAEFFYSLCKDKYDFDVIEMKQMILDTKTHIPSTPLSEKFIDYDMSICGRDFETLLKWEGGIRQEYSKFNNKEYLNGRVKFLESIINKFPMNMDNILDLINWCKKNYQ